MSKDPFVVFLVVLSVALLGCLNDDDGGKEDANKAPTAQIESIEPNPAYIGQTVKFSGKGLDEDGFVTEYQWGSSIDGELSTNSTFSTNNLSVGPHIIYFKVMDDEEVWSSKVDVNLFILPENHAPTGNISSSKRVTEVGEQINFSAENISDPDGDELSYNWNFGDGNTSNEIETQHSYSQAGVYNVTLIVKDGKNFNGKSIFNLAITIEEISYGVEAKFLQDTVAAELGGQSDFVLAVRNIGSRNDTFNISVQANDSGFNISVEEGYNQITVEAGEWLPLLVHVTSPSSGLHSATLRVSSQGDPSVSTSLRLYVDASIVFGNTTERGDTVDVWYAGVQANDGILFDTNIEAIFKSDYPRQTSASEHYDLLPAANIGCDGSGIPDENCEGGRQMIPGFDEKLVGMREGQTLAVRIPARDAYGENPDTHPLGGKDLIFIITLIAIE